MFRLLSRTAALCFLLQRLKFKFGVNKSLSRAVFPAFQDIQTSFLEIEQCNLENVLHNCHRFHLMLWKVLTEVLSQALTISFSLKIRANQHHCCANIAS